MMIIRVLRKFEQILSQEKRRKMFSLAILMLIGGVLETFSAYMILPFMNVIIDPLSYMENGYVYKITNILNIESPRGLIILFAVVLAFLYILKNVFLIYQNNIQYSFVYSNMLMVQEQLLHSYLIRPYEFFLGVKSGEVIRVIGSDTSTSFMMLMNLLTFFTEGAVSITLIVLLFLVSPNITVSITIVLIIMIFLILHYIKPRIQKAGFVNVRSSANMNQWVLQSIEGIKELKIMEKEAYFEEGFSKEGREFVESTRQSVLLNQIPRFLLEASAMGTFFIVIAVLVYFGSSIESLIPSVSVAAMAALRLLPALNKMAAQITTIAYSEPKIDKMVENMAELRKMESSWKQRITISHSHLSTKSFEKSIKINHIEYTYPGGSHPVLSEAQLTIKKGQSVGIVGASGSGKTTLVDVMLGLLNPQKGIIKVDDWFISEDVHGWLAQIGYIPQNIFILDADIRLNVAFGLKEKEIDDEKVWNALDEAALGEFVRSLPEGLGTQLGEHGTRLSGGQRQRIGIARALYTEPAVLVCDEATSALDNETENEIMDAINHLHGRKTLIIIAHRLTTIEKCDVVFKVENGKVINVR